MGCGDEPCLMEKVGARERAPCSCRERAGQGLVEPRDGRAGRCGWTETGARPSPVWHWVCAAGRLRSEAHPALAAVLASWDRALRGPPPPVPQQQRRGAPVNTPVPSELVASALARGGYSQESKPYTWPPGPPSGLRALAVLSSLGRGLAPLTLLLEEETAWVFFHPEAPQRAPWLNRSPEGPL